MNAIISKAELSGRVNAIASKSIAHRSLICASLADRKSEIAISEISEDIEATIGCLVSLGAEIEKDGTVYTVNPIRNIPKGPRLRCRESGSTLRFLLPVAAALGADAEFEMSARLPDRPIYPLDREMEKHGCTILRPEHDIIKCCGKMSGGEYSVEADVSSQFISGILLAMPILGGGTVRMVGNVESSGYIDLTADSLTNFGIEVEKTEEYITARGKYLSPGKIDVEGDWSNAAFWLCAGALTEGGIECGGLNMSSRQGDRKILEILKDMGAHIKIQGDNVKVSRGHLRSVNLDASDITDLIPVIAATASVAEGTTKISGASRLRLKESDRLHAVTDMLCRLGADVTELEDGLVINGKEKLIGGTVSSYWDHRIAMSAAVASIMCTSVVTVCGAEAVNKSYQEFWNDFTALGGMVSLDTIGIK